MSEPLPHGAPGWREDWKRRLDRDLAGYGSTRTVWDDDRPAPDLELARRRLAQIEQRIVARHPKTARDGELASLLSSLRDALGS